MRDVMRRRHYSIRTERTYCDWVRRYVLHFGMSSRADLVEGEKKIEAYLTYLARDRNVAPSTQNQALNALVFLYKHVLKVPLNERINAERARRTPKVPVVLTREETKRIISAMDGTHQLIVKLLYGSGIRIIECLRLRVHDIDFGMKTLTIRSGKGDKDRVTTLPPSLQVPLETHLERVKAIHESDLTQGTGSVLVFRCTTISVFYRRDLTVCGRIGCSGSCSESGPSGGSRPASDGLRGSANAPVRPARICEDLPSEA